MKPMTPDRVKERQIVAKLYGEDQFVLDLCQSWLEQNEQITEMQNSWVKNGGAMGVTYTDAHVIRQWREGDKR